MGMKGKGSKKVKGIERQSDWFSPGISGELDTARREARSKGRITYDCLDAIVVTKEKVKCRKGHRIGLRANDGSISLFTVLTGRSNSVCKDCRDYRTEAILERGYVISR